MSEIYRDGDYVIEFTPSNSELKISSKERSKVESLRFCDGKLCELPTQFKIPAGIRREDYLWIRGTWMIIRKSAENEVEQVIAESHKIAASQFEKEEQVLLKNVPGLRELEKAYTAREKYHEEFEKMMDDEYNDGVSPPTIKVPDIQELERRFPIAATYLICEEYANSSAMSKMAGIYQKAVDEIAVGEDHEESKKEADQRWSEAASASVERS